MLMLLYILLRYKISIQLSSNFLDFTINAISLNFKQINKKVTQSPESKHNKSALFLVAYTN
jgi:hypothetical protein